MAKEVLRELLRKGWVHARMFFEVMGASEDIAKSALAEHIAKIRKMENLKILSERLEEPARVEDPPKQFRGKEAYSQFADVEIAVSSFENLFYTVIFFGPSSVEIMEPREMKIGFDSAQTIVNALAELMHRYAAGGAGGIVISTKK